MSDFPNVTAITGGIGSGKSIVSAILSIMGYPVYDCDSRAKSLMDTSREIQSSLIKEFSESAIINGSINRPFIASQVFKNPKKLAVLNSIVHPHVKKDVEKWIIAHPGHVFIETAILQSSNLKELMNDVIEVIAPIDLRISRVMRRDNTTEEKVLSRINSQKQYNGNLALTKIINDDIHPILPQIEEYLRNFEQK